MNIATRSRLPGKRGDEGWTLIELLIVISIIMILASMAMVEYRNSVTAAKEATLRSQLFIMRDAIDQYYADKAKYPESLQTLVSESYLRALPRDPFTTSSDTWQTVAAEPEGTNVTASAGIFDVKSGYDGNALDGSRIADWF
ncbi:MAG TPA: prepilin-type N-terminal cleavage/methylation domain-containing protein [Vicinamibacterales bacterium]|nr:prepilin-type N-terminal cleavage/methylation domain-containing protein [Vicinamibacterales bacterium]